MKSSDLGSFAYVADDYLQGKIKAVCLDFPGLGTREMRDGLDRIDTKPAHQGMLFVYPFVNPWNWMSPGTVKFVDQVLETVQDKYGIKNCPLFLRGGSMGGYCVFAYAMFSRHKPVAVLANCPVTDMDFHLTERPGLPRTIHDAMGDYSDISALLRERSPNYHPEKLPDCRYLIIHGCNDKAVSKTAHSDKLAPLMRRRGLSEIYLEDEKMKHCNPMSYETVLAVEKFTADILK
ncbi:MAG: prolyl oligopeptidase family serine peptidase [Victivallales bacterium]|nr:prolyl oligopeptidase family serine peptidase [Victivallales bacterium]